MIYHDKYHWKEGLVEIFPGKERIFRVGNRVSIHHKQKKYSGIVIEVKKFNERNGVFPHPEVFIKTDELVDSVPGALFDGFGVRGESSLFYFEDETGEDIKKLRGPLVTDIPKEELEIFKRLKPSLRRELIKSHDGIPFDYWGI